MQRGDLAPAGVEEARAGAPQTVAPWEECAGGGGLGAAKCGAGGNDQQQQQAGREQQLQSETQAQVTPLPTGPFHSILDLLPPQYQACNGRLACKDAWRHLSGVHHRTAHLSQLLPPHAVPWFELYGPEALKQLSFREKLTRAMAAAAASGSEANLAAVWGLVRQGLHPELLQRRYITFCSSSYDDDAGVVLVREGHAHLLPWLLNNCCPLNAEHTLLAAAQHCDLAGLQSVWELLQPQLMPSHHPRYKGLVHDALVGAARSSSTEASIAKMEWLLLRLHGPAGATSRIPSTAAAAAAATGDLARLRWMLQRGCDFNGNDIVPYGSRVLPTAMWHAGLEVVEWLVQEAGCRLPGPDPAAPAAAAAAAAAADDDDGEEEEEEEAEEEEEEEGNGEDYRMGLVAAAAASGSTAKLQWLRDRGQLQSLPPAAMRHVFTAAAAEGQLETLRYLQRVCGVGLPNGVAYLAVRSGNVAAAAWVLQQGGRELFADHVSVWYAGAGSGCVDMMRWLSREGMGGTPGNMEATVTWLVKAWPSDTQQQRASLLPAVQLAMQSTGSPSSSGSGGDGGSGGSGDSSGLEGDGGGGALAPGATPGGPQQYQKLLAAAAGCGSLPLCAYLHSQLQLQGPLAPEVLLEAVKSGCEALVEWLLRHGCALPKNTLQLFLTPARHGDLATLRCLRRMGVPWPRGLLPGAVRGLCPLPMLQWLVAEGVRAGAGEVAEALEAAVSMDVMRCRRRQLSALEVWLRHISGRAGAGQATRGVA